MGGNKMKKYKREYKNTNEKTNERNGIAGFNEEDGHIGPSLRG